MVPVDIKKYYSDVEIISQGTWCAVQRPAMLKTDSPAFARYAEMFYRAQREVLGESSFYATDPFHEGGITADMSPRTISRIVLSEMLNANESAVWIIQSWQSNPSFELLAGLADVKNGKEHALILDLYAESNLIIATESRNPQNTDIRLNLTEHRGCIVCLIISAADWVFTDTLIIW